MCRLGVNLKIGKGLIGISSLLIFIVILFFIFLAGCAGNKVSGLPDFVGQDGIFTQPQPSELATCLEGCDNNNNSFYCKRSCYINQSLKSNDVSYCEPILELGKEKLNLTKGDRGELYTGCVNHLSLEKNRPDLCDIYKRADLAEFIKRPLFERDFCLSHVAYIHKDPGICERIADTGYEKKINVSYKESCIENAQVEN